MRPLAAKLPAATLLRLDRFISTAQVATFVKVERISPIPVASSARVYHSTRRTDKKRWSSFTRLQGREPPQCP